MLFEPEKISWHGGHLIRSLFDAQVFKGIWIQEIKDIYSYQLGPCPSSTISNRSYTSAFSRRCFRAVLNDDAALTSQICAESLFQASDAW